jgi:hypothetical protein
MDDVKAEDALRRWGPWVAVDTKPRFASVMSNVWRVRRQGAERGDVFALKTLRYRKGPGTTAYQRFEREIQILTALKSRAGIVDVIDHSLATSGGDNEVYYVMPWAETSLERASKAYRSHQERVLQIAVGVCDALGAAHAAGIIHRDVKPANVLLYGDEQEPRVADFGISYLVEQDRLTKDEAHTVGTDDFVAPELRGGGRSGNVTPAADVYSLGKTLYAAVSGGVVLPREWLDEARFDLVKMFDDPRLEHMKGLLRRMIAERPADRYQTMAECRTECERALSNLRSGTSYRPDMYGGRDSPVERFARLSKNLDTLADHRREDAVQDAQREAFASARTRTALIDAIPNAMAGPVGEPRPAGLTAAAEAAEELLAVGTALVQHNDLPGVRRWLSPLVTAVRTRDDAATVSARWIMPPAATLAVHGAGALAWHRRRLKLLRLIVDAQLTAPGAWIHHEVLANRAAAVMPWVLQVIGVSPVLQRADNALSATLESPLGDLAGIVALKSVIAMPQDELQAWLDSPQGHNVFWFSESFPGFFKPALSWTSGLPQQFGEDPAFEQEVAQTLFDTTPVALRAHCRRITPALVRMIEIENRSRNHGARWVPRYFGREWEEWTATNEG